MVRAHWGPKRERPAQWWLSVVRWDTQPLRVLLTGAVLPPLGCPGTMGSTVPHPHLGSVGICLPH